jgi:hypothetical protein
MSDEHRGAEGPPANGRPADAAKSGLQRYPTVDQTDAVQGERRTFSPAPETPAPREAARDAGCPASTTDGRMGPGGDPAEGKRQD